MGLFERTKHLDRLARQIADENLRRLGAPASDEATKRQVLELEAILREYRLNLQETEARKQLASSRVEAARTRAQTWHDNASLARSKGRADLADRAVARAHVHEREGETAAHDLEHHAAAVSRIETEIAEVERRVAALRALRRGVAGALPPAPAPSGLSTRALQRRPARDTLEEEIEKLKGS